VNVVVYGGRAYEDSLLELQNITIKAGFTPLACAAFIGEHSFSSPKTPIASMRPDSEDIATAREFGMLIREKLKNVGSLAELEALKIPGKWPYRKRLVDKIKIAPAVDRKRCNLCGMCLNACPNGAIYRTNHILTDKRRCLLCCACVKICPHHAKVAKNLLVALYSRILSFKCRTRKLPALFL
jgi:ferredoxin